LLEVRVIHGKGIGQLRRTVHALLARQPEVVSYAPASEAFGGWGATMVHLRPPPDETSDSVKIRG
jgi:dsDNA-specific endonuclease/ATPase MutS2